MITQSDVRQIQLAKAALHAGCTLLLDHYGIERVERIRLAGAFGTHIDPVHALVLGLVRLRPRARDGGRERRRDRRAHRARQPERASRDRATSCAASRRSRLRSSRFQEHFVSAMAIPRRRPVRAARASCPAAGPSHGARRERRSA